MEINEELELLLNNFIITKEKNKEAYYKIKSKIKKLREFTTQKLGCDIILNSNLVKLEKLPSIIDTTFKIEEFDNEKDYILFMLVIMFLEDKAKEEQFIMSNLTTFITNTLATIPNKKITIDFKDFSTRKSLVDVLKYSIKLGMIKQIDGNDNLFKEVIETEVLYENTGISHFIVRQFKDEIFTKTKPIDFLNTLDTEDELNKKRYYTYRTLLFYPVYYYDELDKEIYAYFINYRNRIKTDLTGILDGNLVMTNVMSYLNVEEKQTRYTFPNSRKVISDIILLVNDYITKENYIEENNYIILNRFELEQLLIKIKNEKGKYFSKEYREMHQERFFDIVVKEMNYYKLLKKEKDKYIFSPLVYLINGNYNEMEETNEI